MTTIRDLLSASWGDSGSLETLGPLIRRCGLDLCRCNLDVIARGTPLYVSDDTEPIDVQRRMAKIHARLVFVLDEEDRVLGVIDLWNLVRRAEELPWTDATPA